MRPVGKELLRVGCAAGVGDGECESMIAIEFPDGAERATEFTETSGATALRIDGPIVQKPFTRDSLLAAVAEALASRA